MKKLLFVSIMSLCGSLAIAAPKYADSTKPLKQNHEYIQKNSAPDYWKFMGYYVPQHNGKACGVATITMLMNALRADQALTSSDELFTHDKIMSLSPKFKKAVGKTGKGIGLDVMKSELELLLQKALPNSKYRVDAYRFDDVPESDALKKLESLLKENENSGDNFIVANFLQSVLTGDPEGVGHHAPVAAYDAKNKMVLVFDPDRTYYEPYWVPLSVFLKSMNTKDSDGGKSRGLIFVQKI